MINYLHQKNTFCGKLSGHTLSFEVKPNFITQCKMQFLPSAQKQQASTVQNNWTDVRTQLSSTQAEVWAENNCTSLRMNQSIDQINIQVE